MTLRQVMPEATGIYGEQASWIRSEALMRLDLGAGRLPGVISTEDALSSDARLSRRGINLSRRLGAAFWFTVPFVALVAAALVSAFLDGGAGAWAATAP